MNEVLQKYIDDGKAKLHSNINRWFKPECLLELDTLSLNTSIDNNSKIVICDQILEKYKIPFNKLGGGTNRYGIMIDGFVYKIAMDRDGKTDNKREFIYSKAAYPDVIKVYESMPNGLIMTCEYIEVFTIDEFYENQKTMKRILERLSDVFFIGDIGIDPKNYYNWGKRTDGSIAILDFAYIYLQSFRTVCCPCGSLETLTYDEDYIFLICPTCGKKHTFWDLRRRIPREKENEEIGDIKQKGYVITDYKVDDVQNLNTSFTDVKNKQKKKKEKPKEKKVVRTEDDFIKELNDIMDSGV